MQEETGQGQNEETTAVVWITADAPKGATLHQSLTAVCQRVMDGERKGQGTAAAFYTFNVSGPEISKPSTIEELQPHVVLISLEGDIDATPATSYEDAMRYLRERTAYWELSAEQEAALPDATVEQLSAWYAGDREPEEDTWVKIIPLIPPWQQRHTGASERAGQEQASAV